MGEFRQMSRKILLNRGGQIKELLLRMLIVVAAPAIFTTYLVTKCNCRNIGYIWYLLIALVLWAGLAWYLSKILKRVPPLTCAGCGAVGWRDDLNPANPVCPVCGEGRFKVMGRHNSGISVDTDVVSGGDIISGECYVETRSGPIRSPRKGGGVDVYLGVDVGDCGGGDCSH